MTIVQKQEIMRRLSFSNIDGIMASDMPYINKFYEMHEETLPTDKECEEGFRFLHGNVLPFTMRVFADVYSYSLPQLEKDYPDLRSKHADKIPDMIKDTVITPIKEHGGYGLGEW